jgi:hypothetical protein
MASVMACGCSSMTTAMLSGPPSESRSSLKVIVGDEQKVAAADDHIQIVRWRPEKSQKWYHLCEP